MIKAVVSHNQEIGKIWIASNGRVFYSRIDRGQGWYLADNYDQAYLEILKVQNKIKLGKQYPII